MFVNRFKGKLLVRGLASVSYDVVIVGGGPTGTFLSLLLTQYGIKHALIEKRLYPTNHPQAHYMNMRTMELLRVHLPSVHRSVIENSPESINWRDFSYCYTVTGRQFARIDHFKLLENQNALNIYSPTNIIHLPQSKFEEILRTELNTTANNVKCYFGYELVSLLNYEKYSEISLVSTDHCRLQISTKFLIAADGANSIIRKSLDISLKGQSSLQTLINVQFRCKGLHKHLHPRPAMLYFAFNESMVGVFVGHQPADDLWVCQIPIFPPFQALQDYSDIKLKDMVTSGLGISDIKELQVEILSVGTWTMNAEVAESFSNKFENIFLVGDSAHRFPPAGGFGMNSGLQDAHNLAWKLAMVIGLNMDKKHLGSYSLERRKVALENTEMSLKNYYKSVSAAQLLGLDSNFVKAAISVTNSGFIPFKKQAFAAALSLGLSTLAYTKTSGNILGDVRVNMLNKFVERDGKSLPLIFPKEDLFFQYDVGSTNQSLTKDIGHSVVVGRRIPHVWLEVACCDINQRVVVSTLDIPRLQSIILGKDISLPTISIIINSDDENYCNSWVNALKEIPRVTEYIQLIQMKKNLQLTKTHEQLQSLHQYPKYFADNNDKKFVSCLNKHFKAIVKTIDGIPWFQTIDISGLWSSCYWSKHSMNGNFVAVVRPDGHVSNVFHVDDESHSLMNHVEQIQSTYHIL